jgi:hypothetical protein
MSAAARSALRGCALVLALAPVLACAPVLPATARAPVPPGSPPSPASGVGGDGGIARTVSGRETPEQGPRADEPAGASPSLAGTALPPPLPKVRGVDAVLADVVQALGGVEGLSRHTSCRTRMDIAFRGLGMSGTIEHLAAAGDRALTITNLPGLASTREGCDGRRCWSEDPINGLRILAGPEEEQALLESAWNGEVRWRELFARVDVRNERDSDGALLECLVMTPRRSGPWTNCFDGRTHLLTLQRMTHAGPQGDVPFTSRIGDWRMVDGLRVPYAMEMQAGPLTFTGRVTEVKLDVPVDDRLFVAPTPPPAGGSGAARR